tara:strand:+ start:20542 stop:21138 length:597 start_codon:yes stop_codon:yes gene_type:complete
MPRGIPNKGKIVLKKFTKNPKYSSLGVKQRSFLEWVSKRKGRIIEFHEIVDFLKYEKALVLPFIHALEAKGFKFNFKKPQTKLGGIKERIERLAYYNSSMSVREIMKQAGTTRPYKEVLRWVREARKKTWGKKISLDDLINAELNERKITGKVPRRKAWDNMANTIYKKMRGRRFATIEEESIASIKLFKELLGKGEI